MSTASAILATVSAILAIATIAASGALLLQVIRIRDAMFYGGAGLGTGAGLGLGVNPMLFNRWSLFNSWDNPAGGDYYSNPIYGNQGWGMGGFGYYGPMDYRYYRVLLLAGVGLISGIIGFLISLLGCCANGNSSGGMVIAYAAGSVLMFIVYVVLLGLGFYFRVIYPFYVYVPMYYYQYYQYNVEGVAFCAVLGVTAVYTIISSIVSCALGRTMMPSDDEDELEFRLRDRERGSVRRSSSRRRMYKQSGV